MLWRSGKTLTLARNETTILGHPAHSLSTELSQVLAYQSAKYQIYLLCVPEKTGELMYKVVQI